MNVYTKQQRIAELAERKPEMSFISLAYYIDVEWMKVAYKRVRKDGATGVDGRDWHDYGKDLEANLQTLIDRFKSGSYFAPPVKRAYIPKGATGKEKRPIGITTIEDKILQKAVSMVLNPIYEHDFKDCSYGFRQNLSVHQAIEAMRKQIMDWGGGYVLEVDIRKYFDTLEHHWFREFFKHRVCDGVLRRIIGKWLKAGIMEDGSISYPEKGTPQGGTISPLISNIYLHEVLDKWFEEEIVPRLTHRAKLIRFADDFVILFENLTDAHRVEKVLPKRLAKFGLRIHPEKTRLIDFRRPVKGQKKGEAFDFLGFTHYWGKSRRGSMIVKLRTAKDRLKRSVRKVLKWCSKNRHEEISDQWAALRRKIIGHYNFFGITFNSRALRRYFYMVKREWRKWLNRRSHENDMPWKKFKLLLKRYPLPMPKIVHSYI